MAVAVGVTGVLALAAFRKASEPDGMLRMTISDAARSPGWVFHGKPYPGRPKGAGIGGHKVNGDVQADGGMAFDQYDQDEAVTLRYEQSGTHSHRGLLVTDRAMDVPLTRVIAMRDSLRALPAGPARDSAMKAFVENHGHPIAARRLFAGSDESHNAIVNLADPQGRPRLRLMVDSTGAASIQFLDTEGHVTKSVTP